jgi:hypothetical protein
MTTPSATIFISWAGKASHEVAKSLKDWIPLVFGGVNCWVSSYDLPSGKLWTTELFEQLELSNVGIVVITLENMESPWILFEAGALSKNLKISRVIPYLVGIRKSELRGPFAQFQAIEADRDGTKHLIHSIREFCQSSESEVVVNHRFHAFWPKFHEELEKSQKLLSNNFQAQAISPIDHQFAVSRLETQVSNLTDMIRDLVQNWNPKASPNSQAGVVGGSADLPLERLVGTWHNPDTDSYGYARFINGSLYMPYCYGGNNSLTSHYTDWALVGEHFFARFEWFHHTAQGFALHKLTDTNTLKGQWWAGAHSEKPTQTEIEAIAQCGSHPEGVVSEWVRIRVSSVPNWVERYFSDLEYYQKKALKQLEGSGE